METPQTCQCEKCGNAPNLTVVKKYLGKFYCPDCISALRLERKQKLREKKEAEEQKLREEHDLAIQKMIQDLQEYGPTPLELPGFPLTLKRNERIYFVAGKADTLNHKVLNVCFILTNFRFFLPVTFYIGSGYITEYIGHENNFYLKYGRFHLCTGIKPVKLSSIIAINPYPNSVTIHFENGKDVRILYYQDHSYQDKGMPFFCLLLSEMVNRINDPIDESVFSPTRERMSDDLKMSVWRRDDGRCARCGSREKLEYDHIIPVSKGGSNTLRNIELLCEACNRAKSNRIM